MIGDESEKNITLKETSILTERLEKSFKFLREAQNEKGYCCYEKDNIIDLHLSALSVRAFKMIQTHDSEILLENALPRLKEIMKSDASKFNENTLVDVLNIIIDYSPRMIELENDIVSRLMEIRQEMGWGRPDPSLGATCRALIALMKSDFSPKDVLNKYLKQLVSSQNPEDGGWGHREGKGEIITTCYALRVLYLSKDSSLEGNISRGKNFLKKFLEDSNWLEQQDNFIISSILLTLGDIKDENYKIINSLASRLYQSMNSDGGWGLAKDLPSEIEYTALSLAALISVGENRFISANIVKSAFNLFEEKQKYYIQELKNYSNNIDILVDKKISNVIQERNNYQKQLNETMQKNEELNLKKEALNSEITGLIKQNNDLKKSLDICNSKIDEQSTAIDINQQHISFLEHEIESKWGRIDKVFKFVIGAISSIIIIYGFFYLWKINPIIPFDYTIDWFYLAKWVFLILLMAVSFFITAIYSLDKLEFLFDSELIPKVIALLLGLIVSSLIYYASIYLIKLSWPTSISYTSIVISILIFILLISQYISYKELIRVKYLIRNGMIRYEPQSQFSQESSYLTSRLYDIMASWPPSKRTTFILELSELRSPSSSEMDILARHFAENEREWSDISVMLDRLFLLPPISRSEIFYALRERFR
jgi:hypothetical protein